MTKYIGKKYWAISGGQIPLQSVGVEPEFTSHDRISILNTCAVDANLDLTIFFEDQEPCGPYSVKIKARRVCKLHFNELIDPLPIPLNKPFACSIRSDSPIVVQFFRIDTSSNKGSFTGTMACGLG